jgi:ethanolamine utilization cobalamin adenosyltransferase
MCEIKFYGGKFTVNKDDYLTLLSRQEILMAKVSPKLTIRSTLITTYGLTQNEYSGIFTNVITLDDLFAE